MRGWFCSRLARLTSWQGEVYMHPTLGELVCHPQVPT